MAEIAEEAEEAAEEAREKLEESPRIGFTAPSFKLQDLEGITHSLDDYAGRAVIINFWTTWCPHCVREMPLLQDLHETGDNVAVLAVNVQEKRADVETFTAKGNYTFPVLLDEQGRVAGSYMVRGLPTTFAVNGEGIITDIRVGAFDAAGLAKLVASASE